MTLFELSSWCTLSFERGTRYYRLHLEQDLWGGWCLTRVHGRKSSRLGRVATIGAGPLAKNLELLAAVAHRRVQRGYRLRPPTRTC